MSKKIKLFTLDTEGNAQFTLDTITNLNGLPLPQVTTAKRDLLTDVEPGTEIFNTTTNEWNGYNGTSWEKFMTTAA